MRTLPLPVGVFARLRRVVVTVATLVLAASAGAQGITLRQFGIGSHFRPGDWAAVRLGIDAGLDEPVTAEVCIDVLSGDGDTAQFGRIVVLDPGQIGEVWLYPHLPPELDATQLSDAVFSVHVYAIEDGQRQREIVAARVSPGSAEDVGIPVQTREGLMAVVGDGRMGLDAFESVPAGSRVIPSMNEITRIIWGVDPADIPDRWEGLSSVESIVWGPANPSELTGESARALRQWLEAGGNMVIVLPETGDPWGLSGASANPLSDLLPSVAPERLEGVRVSELLSILSKTDTLLNQVARVRIQRFDPARLDRDWAPSLALPCPRDPRTGNLLPRADSLDASVLGITRSVGFGRLSIVGIDADSLFRRNLDRTGLPQADIFWNRFLGRRADAPSQLQYQQVAQDNLLASEATTGLIGKGDLVNFSIGMGAQAVVGVLGAFLFFLVYWALAGPVAALVLAKLGRVRLGWVIFSAVALAFGIGAWVVGSVSRLGASTVQHLTVLDQIGGTGPLRATSWFTAALHGYGTAEVKLAAASDRDLLASWAPPGALPESFPDPGQVRVLVDDSAALKVPSRATAALFEARWQGEDSQLSSALPGARDPERPLIQTVVLGTTQRMFLSGVVTHQLSAPLQDVNFIHVSPLRSPARRMVSPADGLISPSDLLPNAGRMARLGAWEPNTPLELAEQLYPGGPEAPFLNAAGDLSYGLRSRYFDTMVATDFGFGVHRVMNSEFQRDSLEMLSIYQMLQPPVYVSDPKAPPPSARIERELGRSLDISPWLTTPCLIITGFLPNASIPVPVEVDGAPVESSGLIMVRVILPLDTPPQSVPATAQVP